MKIAGSIVWIVALSVLVTACGVKAPPLPPLKEDPRFRGDDKRRGDDNQEKESKKRKKEVPHSVRDDRSSSDY